MRLQFDKNTERLYETGIDRVVLYPRKGAVYRKGVTWNGITTLTEKSSGAEATPIFANNSKYLNVRSAEEFGCTLDAYSYPPEFANCVGSAQIVPGLYLKQQKQQTFGLCYRSLLGNDEDATDYGYKLHLVYGCEAIPAEKANQTVGESPDPLTYSWDISANPVRAGANVKPTAHIEIDSTKIPRSNLKKLEDILYGTDETEPRLPLPAEVFALAVSVDIYYDGDILVIEGATEGKVFYDPDGSLYISPEFALGVDNSILSLRGA